jgi:hypothetical protein
MDPHATIQFDETPADRYWGADCPLSIIQFARRAFDSSQGTGIKCGHDVAQKSIGDGIWTDAMQSAPGDQGEWR